MREGSSETRLLLDNQHKVSHVTQTALSTNRKIVELVYRQSEILHFPNYLRQRGYVIAGVCLSVCLSVIIFT